MKMFILHFGLIMVIVFSLMGCIRKEEEVPESAARVLTAILEAPNETLYNPEQTAYALDVDQTQEEIDRIQEALDEEKRVWKDELGDCFAGDMFDTFYSQWERTEVLGAAFVYNMESRVTDMRVVDQDPEDNIIHVFTAINVTGYEPKEGQYEMEWRIILDKENPELLQSVELLNAGGFLD